MKKETFLRDYQYDAVNKMSNGCILNGGTGSGKSRTSLYYYFKKHGGECIHEYKPMKTKKPLDLYIITTAKKRDKFEWEEELSWYRMSTDPELNSYKNTIVVDSWNNIQKYKEIKGAFFIFDEDKVTGNGAWVKAFHKIAKNNEWIILSATPGDKWSDYIPVFIANGFYKNKTEFSNEHCVYSRFTKYPQIERYINTGRLIRLRNKILVDMDFERKTVQHHEDVLVSYDISKYKDVYRRRWDPFKDEPVQQASGMCYVLRRIVNEDESRIVSILEILEKHPRAIIFYNYDYELQMLRNTFYDYEDYYYQEAINPDGFEHFEVAEWNGHMHQEIPKGKRWVYLVQYTAGCEGWNCIDTNCIIFFSQNYSYKVLAQAIGRIDRLNTPFIDLYYYHLKSKSPIDIAISKALKTKKKFNETKFAGGLDYGK